MYARSCQELILHNSPYAFGFPLQKSFLICHSACGAFVRRAEGDFAAHDKYQKVCTLHKPAFWLRIPPYERTAPQKMPFRLRISPYEWNAQVNFLPLTPHTIKSALSANPPFELISYYMNVLYCKNRRRRFLPKLIFCRLRQKIYL